MKIINNSGDSGHSKSPKCSPQTQMRLSNIMRLSPSTPPLDQRVFQGLLAPAAILVQIWVHAFPRFWFFSFLSFFFQQRGTFFTKIILDSQGPHHGTFTFVFVHLVARLVLYISILLLTVLVRHHVLRSPRLGKRFPFPLHSHFFLADSCFLIVVVCDRIGFSLCPPFIAFLIIIILLTDGLSRIRVFVCSSYNFCEIYTKTFQVIKTSFISSYLLLFQKSNRLTTSKYTGIALGLGATCTIA